MPRLQEFETWEPEFVKLFMERVDEEPLYEYFHLYRKGLTPKEAVEAYLKENPDYQEKFEDLVEEKVSAPPADGKVDPAFEALAKKAMEMKRKREAEQRMSQFCPNCARKIGDKKRCKCGWVKGRDK